MNCLIHQSSLVSKFCAIQYVAELSLDNNAAGRGKETYQSVRGHKTNCGGGTGRNNIDPQNRGGRNLSPSVPP